MTRVKICGLSRLEDIDFVNQLKPDFVGFVFVPKSRRFVNYEWATTLRSYLTGEIKTVGVFVNARIDDIVGLVEKKVVDWVQLHGSEEEAYINAVRSRVKTTIVKAFDATLSEEVSCAKVTNADYVLFDNGSGGTGRVFDWSLLTGVKRPFFLAGGLGPDNVVEAINLLHPWCVDVSSGVEIDGHKDFYKIQEVINRVKT